MAAAGHPGEDAGLYEAVKAVGEELCPALGLTIPVGKDSMSMKTRWQEGSEQREMTSPLSLVITAFARVEDVRHTVTPQLSTEDNALLLIDLGKATTRWAPPRWRRFTASSATSRPTCAMSRS
jgi:phosphoribosylformylglycinamidine synthase